MEGKWRMSHKITVQSDLAKDLAGTHHPHAPAAERNSPEIARDFEILMRDGYAVIENLLDANALSRVRDACGLVLENHKTGRNNFEGLKTQRVYNALAKTRALDQLATHPRILGVMDRLFSPNFLLSTVQILNVLPGEDAQLLHTDDGFYKVPRPRQALGAATIWAIDDFTPENGATRIIPSSHLWGQEQLEREMETIPAVMPAGSVLFFLGTTKHGAGQNRSSDPRLAITCQYCDAFMRQQENFMLGVPKETVQRMAPDLQSLLGYSIHPPFMGFVDGVHPLRYLEDA